MNFKLVIGLVLAGLIVFFTLQNVEVVEVRFFFWTVSMSRALMILSVLAVGMILGWILRSWGQRHRADRPRHESRSD